MKLRAKIEIDLVGLGISSDEEHLLSQIDSGLDFEVQGTDLITVMYSSFDIEELEELISQLMDIGTRKEQHLEEEKTDISELFDYYRRETIE